MSSVCIRSMNCTTLCVNALTLYDLPTLGVGHSGRVQRHPKTIKKNRKAGLLVARLHATTVRVTGYGTVETYDDPEVDVLPFLRAHNFASLEDCNVLMFSTLFAAGLVRSCLSPRPVLPGVAPPLLPPLWGCRGRRPTGVRRGARFAFFPTFLDGSRVVCSS
jgi:hypothetical protein